MKTNRQKLLARFERETRFEVAAVPAVPFRGTRESELERLKSRLLRAVLHEATDAESYGPLRRAATEAAAVAWMTPFPLLFLPALFEEKALTVRGSSRAPRVCVIEAGRFRPWWPDAEEGRRAEKILRAPQISLTVISPSLVSRRGIRTGRVGHRSVCAAPGDDRPGTAAL